VVLECFDYEPGSVRLVGVYESGVRADVEALDVAMIDGVATTRWVEECDVVVSE